MPKSVKTVLDTDVVLVVPTKRVKLVLERTHSSSL